MRVFICYRRVDSSSTALALKTALESSGRVSSVFLDTVSGEAGEEFPVRLEHEIEQADVVVALIGPEWARSLGKSDWVRREIAYAYANGVPVVPMMHGGGRMPSSSALPRAMRRIASQNAIQVSDQSIDGRALAAAIGLHASHSKLSTKSASGLGAWLWRYCTFPFAPMERTRALSRGGMATITGVAVVLAVVPTVIATICYSIIMQTWSNVMTLVAMAAMSLVYVLALSVMAGSLTNLLALVLGGAWRPVRAIAAASVFFSWYYMLTLFFPFGAMFYLSKNDPDFEHFLFFVTDSSPEVSFELFTNYLSANPYAERVASVTMYVLVGATIYAVCTMRVILAFLRVDRVAQWAAPIVCLGSIWAAYYLL